MTETTTNQTEQLGLTIQDLTLTLQVIQVASSRGVFKADELSVIGGLYDRIFKFLDAAGAIQKAPDESQEAANAPTGPTVTTTETAVPVKKAAAKKSKGK